MTRLSDGAIVAVIETKLYAEQVRLTGHTKEVYRVSISADGKRVPRHDGPESVEAVAPRDFWQRATAMGRNVPQKQPAFS